MSPCRRLRSRMIASRKQARSWGHGPAHVASIRVVRRPTYCTKANGESSFMAKAHGSLVFGSIRRHLMKLSTGPRQQPCLENEVSDNAPQMAFLETCFDPNSGRQGTHVPWGASFL